MNPGESTTRSYPGVQPLVAPPGGSPGSKSGGSGSWWRPADLSPAERQLAHVRQAVLLTLLALAILIGVRLWLLEGLVRVVRIEGPSMAMAFAGTHYRVICEDCRFPFRCDAHDVPGSGLAVCPNCGYRENRLDLAALQPGERVLIDRWQRLTTSPRRGEVVAARAADGGDGASGEDGAEPLVIKRVVALPGETLAIRGGDLYANDKLVRKSPAQWRELRVLVHDNNYQPQKTQGLPARWQSGAEQSGWIAEGTGFRFELAKDTDPSWAASQLSFVPWRCSLAGRRTEIVSIFDNGGYNQGADQPPFHVVPDFGLSCKLRTVNAPVAIVFDDGHDVFRIVLEPEKKQATLAIRESPVLEAPFGASFDRRAVEVEAALCDQQVFLSVGGRIIFRHAFERTVRSGQTSDAYEACQPIVIGTTANVRVSDLRVWRDIYYQHPLGLDRPWQAEGPLAAGEFAVLGDNPPVSVDSRNGLARIWRQAIRGRVLRPFWSER